MNFTTILKRKIWLKIGFPALITIYQLLPLLKEAGIPFAIRITPTAWAGTAGAQSGVHPDAMEPIEDMSVVLMDNMKLYFMILYLLIIVAFVALYVLLRRKRRKKLSASEQQEVHAAQEAVPETETGMTALSWAPEDKEIMSCEVKEEILKKLAAFEEGCKFTDKHFNLSALSVKLKTNTKYLSYVINNCKKKDFNSYINELRILYIIKKMEENPAYLHYKISYLADESGFSSHSKFTSVFKSVVGMSPSRYMDLLTERK